MEEEPEVDGRASRVLRVDQDVHRLVKVRAARQGRSIKELVDRAIINELSRDDAEPVAARQTVPHERATSPERIVARSKLRSKRGRPKSQQTRGDVTGLRLDPDLVKLAKHRAVDDDTTLVEIVSRALRAYLHPTIT